MDIEEELNCKIYQLVVLGFYIKKEDFLLRSIDNNSKDHSNNNNNNYKFLY